MTVDPAQLSIVHYPDPVLRKRATALPAVTDEVRAVADRMIELMRQADGIGLAAPQVGLPWRLFVCHVGPNEERELDTDPLQATAEPFVYINPVLSSPAGAVEPFNEGCLSLPDIRGDVLRPTGITITALDRAGKPFTQRGTGLIARCWQHEVDHLDGVLILDRMVQRDRLRNRVAVRQLEQL